MSRWIDTLLARLRRPPRPATTVPTTPYGPGHPIHDSRAVRGKLRELDANGREIIRRQREQRDFVDILWQSRDRIGTQRWAK